MDQQEVDDDFSLAHQLHTLLQLPRQTREGIDELLDDCRRRLKRRMTSITEFVSLLRYILEGRPQSFDILKVEELVECVSASTEGRAVADDAIDSSGSEGDTETPLRRCKTTRTDWKKTYSCRRTLIEKWSIDVVFYYGFHLAERSFTEAAITATYRHGGSFETLREPLNRQIWASIPKNESRVGANRTRRNVAENFKRIVRSDMDSLKGPTETFAPDLLADLVYEKDENGIIRAYSWIGNDGTHYVSPGFPASPGTRNIERDVPSSVADTIPSSILVQQQVAPSTRSAQQDLTSSISKITRVLCNQHTPRRAAELVAPAEVIRTSPVSTLQRRPRGAEWNEDCAVEEHNCSSTEKAGGAVGNKRRKDELAGQGHSLVSEMVSNISANAEVRFIASIGTSIWSCTSSDYDTLQGDWHRKYLSCLETLRHTFQDAAGRTSKRTQQLMICATKWLGQLQLAKLATSQDSSASCDAIAMSGSTFSRLSELGFQPFRCVLIKDERFNDDDCINVHQFLKRFERRYKSQSIEAQDPGTGDTLSMDPQTIIERYEAVCNVPLSKIRPEEVVNLLDIRDILSLARPRALILERFQRPFDWVAKGTRPGKDY
ncbi:hypothetical protein LTR62_002186 [Meristemomyces frigidus]|uniref:Uncharacterized protein n=1 Tax=Meristemomyces frigidus TaxID=1508187 RepID=A0AAN7YM19_9PEZI|nr:hypothetical protein LTR62_002186 [Meristemomyces frigidus]